MLVIPPSDPLCSVITPVSHNGIAPQAHLIAAMDEKQIEQILSKFIVVSVHTKDFCPSVARVCSPAVPGGGQVQPEIWWQYT